MSKTTKKSGNGDDTNSNELDAILNEVNKLHEEIKRLKQEKANKQQKSKKEFQELTRVKTSNNNPKKIFALSISRIGDKIALSHLWMDENKEIHPKGRHDLIAMFNKGSLKTLINALQEAHDSL